MAIEKMVSLSLVSSIYVRASSIVISPLAEPPLADIWQKWGHSCRFSLGFTDEDAGALLCLDDADAECVDHLG